MTEAIKLILYEIPRYIIYLIKFLIKPSDIINNINFVEQEDNVNITKALVFAAVSLILVEIIGSYNVISRLPLNTNIYIYYATRFVINFCRFVGYLIAIIVSIKIVNGYVRFENILIVHGYLYGIILLMVNLVGSISEGYLAYGGKEKLIISGILYFGFGIVLMWYIFAWKVYQHICKITIWRRIVALSLSLLLSYPVSLITSFMEKAYLQWLVR